MPLLKLLRAYISNIHEEPSEFFIKGFYFVVQVNLFVILGKKR